MKKSIKKLIVIFFALFSILCTKVYGNMTLEAMEESARFYDEHKFFIDVTEVISVIMELSFLVFVIVIPIIIIYKILKLRNNLDERIKSNIKILGIAEILFIINRFIINCSNELKYGSESVLYINVFIILISLLNIAIVLVGLLKKNKNRKF